MATGFRNREHEFHERDEATPNELREAWGHLDQK